MVPDFFARISSTYSTVFQPPHITKPSYGPVVCNFCNINLHNNKKQFFFAMLLYTIAGFSEGVVNCVHVCVVMEQLKKFGSLRVLHYDVKCFLCFLVIIMVVI